MPTFAPAGQNLQQAGDALTTSGNTLVSNVAPLLAANGKITILVRNIKNTVNASQPILRRIGNFLTGAGNTLDAIKVPSLKITTTRIDLGLTKVDVVTGIKITQVKLFPAVAKALKDAGNEVKKLVIQLAATETSLAQLQQELPGLGTSFKDTGNQLVAGGNGLKQAGTKLANLP